MHTTKTFKRSVIFTPASICLQKANHPLDERFIPRTLGLRNAYTLNGKGQLGASSSTIHMLTFLRGGRKPEDLEETQNSTPKLRIKPEALKLRHGSATCGKTCQVATLSKNYAWLSKKCL